MGLAMSYRKLGMIYLERNKFEKTEDILLKSLSICLENNISMFIIKNYQSLYLTAKKLNQTQKALSYLELY